MELSKYVRLFSTIKSAKNIYKNYLQQQQQTFQFIQKKGRFSYQYIKYPYTQPNINLLIKLFQEQKLERRNIVFHINPSYMLGMKRLYYESYLKVQVYKGIQQPTKQLTQSNPDNYILLDQLQFNLQVYYLMDKKISQKIKVKKNPHLFQELQKIVDNVYEKQQFRHRDRLLNQLKVPHTFLELFEYSTMYFQNNVFLSGLNEFTLRSLLSKYYNFEDLKVLYVSSLEYSLSKSTKVQNFQFYARQYIYTKMYTILQKFEIEDTKKLKNTLKNPLIIAPSYVIQSLEKSQQDQKQEQVKITPQSQQDKTKIQKNALLQVMLGQLWNNIYTKNKFPYIQQNYFKLLKQDKQQLNNIFQSSVAKYTAIKNKFYQTNNKNK